MHSKSETFPNKVLCSQSYGFSSRHVWVWELDHKESVWTIKLSVKNWCFQTVVLEKTLENSLDCKEIQPVNPKGNQSWIFIGKTNVEAEGLIFSHLQWRANWLEKTLMLWKHEGRRRGWQRKRWLDGNTNSMDMSLSKLQETLKSKVTWHAGVHGVKKSQIWLCHWTATILLLLYVSLLAVRHVGF